MARSRQPTPRARGRRPAGLSGRGAWRRPRAKATRARARKSQTAWATQWLQSTTSHVWTTPAMCKLGPTGGQVYCAFHVDVPLVSSLRSRPVHGPPMWRRLAAEVLRTTFPQAISAGALYQIFALYQIWASSTDVDQIMWPNPASIGHNWPSLAPFRSNFGQGSTNLGPDWQHVAEINPKLHGIWPIWAKLAPNLGQLRLSSARFGQVGCGGVASAAWAARATCERVRIETIINMERATSKAPGRGSA